MSCFLHICKNFIKDLTFLKADINIKKDGGPDVYLPESAATNVSFLQRNRPLLLQK